MSILTIENLKKTYRGGKIAVDHLSLSIEPGEICGFIGPNGSGKTTTIRCVMGLVDFECGRITVDGHAITEDPVACKSVMAYLPDNPDLYQYLTGIQYLNFVADMFGVDAATRTERIREYSWCCGAGGGCNVTNEEFSVWTAKERLEEAVSTGASVLVTACPWCKTNFNRVSDGPQLDVVDIIDLVRSAM